MIIAFTGAGISKDSGISTFMERADIRDKLHRSYAQNHPTEYNNAIKELISQINVAHPNDAHYVLAKYNISIITMNIDNLHQKAGSKNVLSLHGDLPTLEQVDIAYTLYNKPVLYGDPAPNYQKAYQIISELGMNDIFLVIGASYSTMIASDLRTLAISKGAHVIEIQDNAKMKVRETIEQLEKRGFIK